MGGAIGVLLFQTAGQRILGDAGYPGTFPFPVLYGEVEGSYRDLIQGSAEARDRLIRAAGRLAERGVGAIAGDCGLMALYQKELAASVSVPVVSSSLALIPMIRRMLGPQRVIGVITGHSEILGGHHLTAAGAESRDGLAVQGMEDQPHFREVVLEGTAPQEYALMKRDLLAAAKRLREGHPKTGAFLLECSNLATFAGELQQAEGLPVFDINLAVHLLRDATARPNYHH